MYQYLETERLIIRPISVHDQEFILELVNTKGWLEFIGDRKVKTVKDAEEYIKISLPATVIFIAFSN